MISVLIMDTMLAQLIMDTIIQNQQTQTIVETQADKQVQVYAQTKTENDSIVNSKNKHSVVSIPVVDTNPEPISDFRITISGQESRRNISGAGRKRLNRMVREGLTYEQALHIEFLRKEELLSNRRNGRQSSVSNTSPTTISNRRTTEAAPNSSFASNTGTKRNRTDSESSEGQHKKQKINTNTEPQRVFKIGVISENYPDHFLSNQHLKRIESAILAAIDNLPINEQKIQFSSCDHKPGYMLIRCVDLISKTWLIKLIESWPPLDGIKLKWIERGDISKKFVYKVFVPGENETCKSFYTRLCRQNDLNTDEWKTLHASKENKGLFVVVSMDECSHEKLKSMNLKAHFNFGIVRFKSKRNESDKNSDRGWPFEGRNIEHY